MSDIGDVARRTRENRDTPDAERTAAAVEASPILSSWQLGDDQFEFVPTRHWGRWVGACVVLVIGAWLSYTVAVNPNIKWGQVAVFLHDDTILAGLKVTLELTVLSMAVGVALGILLALMRLSDNPVLQVSSNLYIWLFRGTPVLVQIIFWYNIALIFPHFGVPGFRVDTNSVITSFGAALLALGLNEGAYMSEIVRAGLISVAHGQMDAALAIGMTRKKAMRYVVIPQALRVIVPPTGNQTIGMLKTTSLVSVIAAQDLLTRAENIYAKNFLVIELLIVASIWYLVCTTVASVGQYFLEQKFAAGATRTQSSSHLVRYVRRRVFSLNRRDKIDLPKAGA